MKNFDKAYENNIPGFGGEYNYILSILRNLPNELKVDLILFNTIMVLNKIIKEDYKGFDSNNLINENFGMANLPKEELTNSLSKDETIEKIIVIILAPQGQCA